MTETALKIQNLTVSYDDNVALEDVNFEAAAGLVHGLIGMNGSGKSTLFKSVMGLIDVDAGTIEIDGESHSAARRAGKVAYAPQNEEIDWDFPVSVREVVMMGRYGHMGLARRAGPADRAAVEDALERTELGEFADRQIGQLSGGQRKRAFVARGLAQDAEILLLDEPFAGVDKRSEETITTLLRGLAAAGKTVVVSTHDIVAVPALCDEVALINRRIIAHGPTADVLIPDLLAEAFGGFVPQTALNAPIPKGVTL
jgi:manganese transport system ATP-binding protein